MMTPIRAYPLYGIPCVYCAFPADRLEIYSWGPRVVHMNRGMHRPCDDRKSRRPREPESGRASGGSPRRSPARKR